MSAIPTIVNVSAISAGITVPTFTQLEDLNYYNLFQFRATSTGKRDFKQKIEISVTSLAENQF